MHGAVLQLLFIRMEGLYRILLGDMGFGVSRSRYLFGGQGTYDAQ